MFFGKYITGRIHVARKEQFCLKCGQISVGQIYMRFEAYVMQKHCIHVECYAEDNQDKFFVGTNNKPRWSDNIIMVDPNNLTKCLLEIQETRPDGYLRDSIPTVQQKCDP